RVPHHRFSDAPRPEDAFLCRAPPVSGSAHAVKLRRMRRAVALAFALAICILRSWQLRLRGPVSLEQRALWLQEAARRVLKQLHAEVVVEGQPAACGLVVSN